MNRALTNWLSGHKTELQRREAEYRHLTAVCDKAFAAWQEAKARGDCRGEHGSYAAYRRAKDNLLRAEMALRSPSEGACSPNTRARGLVPAAWRGTR